jgi:hypothetical protein
MARRLSALWELLRSKENRAIVGWVGSGIVTVVTGAWVLVAHLSPAETTAEPKQNQATPNCYAQGNTLSAVSCGAMHLGNTTITGNVNDRQR